MMRLALWAAIAIGAGCALGVYLARPQEQPAIRANLIGVCNGQVYAGAEESAFPKGCDWIEPIRYEVAP